MLHATIKPALPLKYLGILMGVFTCLVVLFLPDRVAGQAGRDGKNVSLPAPVLAVADHHQANFYVSSSRTFYWADGRQQVMLGPPAMSSRPPFIIHAWVRVVFIAVLLLPALVLARRPEKQNPAKQIS